MTQLFKQINWWKVAAYGLLTTSAGGMLIACTLDGDMLGWATATLVALVYTRIEWVLGEVARSTNDEDT